MEDECDLTTQPSTIKNERVDKFFEKKFTIASDEVYKMPRRKSMFKSDEWEVDELQAYKKELNQVKNLLNNYNLSKWHHHTNLRNKARDIAPRLKRDFQPEFLTQAWCKFYEILSSYPVVPLTRINDSEKCFKSVHVCEAPGAFIAALNHWMQLEANYIDWDWIATTLNPYYEGNQSSIMINDDRFMGPTLQHWCFGEDNTGNLMVLRNLDNLVDMAKPNDDVLLVTADGSIDCFDMPDEQERTVAHLHFCETVAAFSVLAPGGSFILKIFTTFECHTICLLYLLSCCFGKVNLFKPVTSKEGNSETYVICLDFKRDTATSKYMSKFRKYYESGLTKAMFDKTDIPESFIKKIIECSAFFKNLQSQVITENIISYESSMKATALKKLKRLQISVADKYVEKYKLKKIKSGKVIVQAVEEASVKPPFCKVRTQDSYNERCMKKNLSAYSKLNQLLEEYNNMTFDILPMSLMSSGPTGWEKLTICIGTSFNKVHSSKFCDTTVLRLLDKLESINLELGSTVEFPPEFEKADLQESMGYNTECTVLTFRYTDPYDNYKTIKLIKGTLEKFNYGETLILTGYSLLTRFNVGLLHLLRCFFTYLEFQRHPLLGCLVIFKEYHPNHIAMTELTQIACLPCTEGKTILEILPGSRLYESDLFPSILAMNGWVIKKYIEWSLHILTKN